MIKILLLLDNTNVILDVSIYKIVIIMLTFYYILLEIFPDNIMNIYVDFSVRVLQMYLFFYIVLSLLILFDTFLPVNGVSISNITVFT